MLLVVDMTKKEPSELRFLPKLLDYLRRREVAFRVVRGIDDLPAPGEMSGVRGVILSGSSLRFTRRIDVAHLSPAMYVLTNLRSVPVLGICFGCQLINVMQGGSVAPMGRLVKDVLPVSGGNCKQQFWFNDRIDRPGIGMRVRASVAIDGVRVPCHLEKDNMTGVLFHPEAEAGKKCGVLDAFVNRCRATKKYNH
jgi:GMP synthase-like glutamine amidotransferase